MMNPSLLLSYDIICDQTQPELLTENPMNNYPNCNSKQISQNTPQWYGHQLNESLNKNNSQISQVSGTPEIAVDTLNQLNDSINPNHNSNNNKTYTLSEKSLIGEALYQQLQQSVISMNMSNREKRCREKRSNPQQPNHTTQSQPCVVHVPVANTEVSVSSRQGQTCMKQREEYNGCDSNGFVKFVEHSILCGSNKNMSKLRKYSMMSELGRSRFSRVFRFQKMDDKTEYAIKITRNVKKYQLAAMNELTILKCITTKDAEDTSCCVHVLDCGLYYEHPMFVFPLLSKSLRTWMNMYIAPFKPFDIEEVTHVMWQLCRGIAFIHSLGIMNTNLKPDNIMLVSDEMSGKGVSAKLKSTQIKIIDFASAIFHKKDKKYHHLIQTRQYRAPEVIVGSEWSFAADIWSLGCILAELVDGKVLFPTHTDANHLHQMIGCIGAPPSHLLTAVHDKMGDIDMDHVEEMTNTKLNTYFVNSNEECAQLYDLCTKMLCWDPNQRISAKAALQHPVFRKQTEYAK